MMDTCDPHDWYWIVEGDDTRYWSSAVVPSGHGCKSSPRAPD